MGRAAIPSCPHTWDKGCPKVSHSGFWQACKMALSWHMGWFDIPLGLGSLGEILFIEPQAFEMPKYTQHQKKCPSISHVKQYLSMDMIVLHKWAELHEIWRCSMHVFFAACRFIINVFLGQYIISYKHNFIVSLCVRQCSLRTKVKQVLVYWMHDYILVYLCHMYTCILKDTITEGKASISMSLNVKNLLLETSTQNHNSEVVVFDVGVPLKTWHLTYGSCVLFNKLIIPLSGQFLF